MSKPCDRPHETLLQSDLRRPPQHGLRAGDVQIVDRNVEGARGEVIADRLPAHGTFNGIQKLVQRGRPTAANVDLTNSSRSLYRPDDGLDDIPDVDEIPPNGSVAPDVNRLSLQRLVAKDRSGALSCMETLVLTVGIRQAERASLQPLQLAVKSQVLLDSELRDTV